MAPTNADRAPLTEHMARRETVAEELSAVLDAIADGLVVYGRAARRRSRSERRAARRVRCARDENGEAPRREPEGLGDAKRVATYFFFFAGALAGASAFFGASFAAGVFDPFAADFAERTRFPVSSIEVKRTAFS